MLQEFVQCVPLTPASEAAPCLPVAGVDVTVAARQGAVGLQKAGIGEERSQVSTALVRDPACYSGQQGGPMVCTAAGARQAGAEHAQSGEACKPDPTLADRGF